MTRSLFPNEQSMYAPIANYWRELGYTVKAEVNHCDVVAIRPDEEPIIVEMKLHFTIALLAQAAERLATSNRVYVAIPEPNQRSKSTDYRRICKAMQIGLLYVSSGTEVSEIISPEGTRKPRQNKSRKKLEKEFHQRKTSVNIGGSSRTKQMTSYREHAIRCAAVIVDAGEDGLKALDIRKSTGIDRAAAILRNNVYRWFEQVEGHINPDGTKQMPRYRIRANKSAEIKEWRARYETAQVDSTSHSS